MEKPDGAIYYRTDGVKYAFAVWTAPPTEGPAACLRLTGLSEWELVRRILDGEFDQVFTQGFRPASGQ